MPPAPRPGRRHPIAHRRRRMRFGSERGGARASRPRVGGRRPERGDARARDARPSEGSRAACEGAVLRGDFAQGLPFRERAFDGCVSVSAAQWLCVGDDAARRAKLHRFFAALRRCLRPGARAVLKYTRTRFATPEPWKTPRRARDASPSPSPPTRIEPRTKKYFSACTAIEPTTRTGRARTRRPRRRANPGGRRDARSGGPTTASCAAAWRRSVRVGDDETIPGDGVGDDRAEREHVGMCRRLLRVLRRARTLDDDDDDDETAAGPSASSMAMDGDPTARVAVREIETIVRDGTACACARVGVVTASRVAPVVETHAAVAGAAESPGARAEQSRARHDRKRRRTPGALDACARLRRVTATVHIAQSHAGDSRETTRLEAMTRDAFAMRRRVEGDRSARRRRRRVRRPRG